MHGITGKIIELNQYKIVSDVDPDTISLPRKVYHRFKIQYASAFKEEHRKKDMTFMRLEHIESTMARQGIDTGVEGVDEGLAWRLMISKKNGRSVLAASGNGKAYVVPGTYPP